jgi:UDP-N-acetylmuramoyl-L-alanyl-D-glutamate--2,6-diaminopimelate ligase
MGRAASRLADYTVVTSDNSRSEKTEDIMEDILEGIEGPASSYTLEPDRREAIRKGIEKAARPHSLVAICGKGDESVQELSDGKFPFDDRQVARKILENMPRRGKQIA